MFMDEIIRQRREMVARYRFVARSVIVATGMLGLIMGATWLSGCGGSNDAAITPTPTPEASASPVLSPRVVLPQEYRLAYKLPGEKNPEPGYNVTATNVQIVTDGSLLILQQVSATSGLYETELVRYTNYGKPGQSQRSLPLIHPLGDSINSAINQLAVSPKQEIYLPISLVENGYINGYMPRLTTSVLSFDGMQMRRINYLPNTFDASGNFYTNIIDDIYEHDSYEDDIHGIGVHRIRDDGKVINLVLPANSETHLAGVAVSPQGEVWSYSLDGFMTAKPDGSDRRFVPVAHVVGEAGARITRCDGEGSLYTDQAMPINYPDSVGVHDLHHQAVNSDVSTRHHYGLPGLGTIASYIRKFKQDGTELAAIPVDADSRVIDFNVDAAGNIYVATLGGVQVYQRVR